jgi:Ca2+-transporting ATPase
MSAPPIQTSPNTGNGMPPGLTAARAAQRLAVEGPNELPASGPRSIWAIALGVAREPMFLLLMACGAIYLAMGSRADAAMLIGFVVVVMAITFFQERRTERALDALRDLTSPRALVLRDGAPLRIAGRDVVRGDLLMIAEGDRVPADAVLLSGVNLSVDESLLTGESVPVRKMAVADGEDPGIDARTAPGAPGGEDLPWLFSGTLVVQGKGTARVLATGERSALGAIGRALASVEEEPTRVQRDTAVVVRKVAIAGVLLSVLIAIGYGVTRGEWLTGLLAGITTAMALLPEELPVVLTVFLGLGAWRIARQRVLTRRVPAIEMLGAATVLCSDKTGTLTQNRMAVAALFAQGESVSLTAAQIDDPDAAGVLGERFHELLEFATLAGHRDPFDPTEQAIAGTTRRLLARTEHLHPEWELVNEYPLSRDLLALSRVWKAADREQFIVAAKGSPEAIVDLCHLDAMDAARMAAEVDRLASRGLRVLGVARADFAARADGSLPAQQHDFEFRLLGLVGLADPLRDAVPGAVAEARTAGVRVCMITGDYPATAMNIAAQAGIDTSAGYLSGDDVAALDEAALCERLRTVNVYCRVVPEQKLRLVNAFKTNGETVAMTGDGVNDAPALKAAHIGIAMGGRGTDVARESAALVLLDDDFSSIVAAIRLGRRIFANLRKVVTFIIAVHVPILGLSLVPVLFGWPLLLMPVHVMFLELIIDPVCSVVFEAEPEEPNAMQRPPHERDASIFESSLLWLGVLQGVLLLVAVIGVYLWARQSGAEEDEVRTLAFCTLVIGNIGLIFTNRSHSAGWLDILRTPNMVLWVTTSAALLVLGAVLGVPALRGAFHFSVPSAGELAVAAAAAIACMVLFEALKGLRRNIGKARHANTAA